MKQLNYAIKVWSEKRRGRIKSRMIHLQKISRTYHIGGQSIYALDAVDLDIVARTQCRRANDCYGYMSLKLLTMRNGKLCCAVA